MSYDEKIQNIEKEIADVKKEINYLKTQITKNKEHHKEITDKLDELNSRMQDLAIELAKNQQAIDMQELVNEIMTHQNQNSEELISSLLQTQRKQVYIYMAVLTAAFLGILAIVAPQIPNFIK